MDIDIRNIEVLDDRMIEVLKTKTPSNGLL
jgi:hypothetical protein